MSDLRAQHERPSGRFAVETGVRQLLMIREFTFPTLRYDVLARLPLRGEARPQAAAG